MSQQHLRRSLPLQSDRAHSQCTPRQESISWDADSSCRFLPSLLAFSPWLASTSASCLRFQLASVKLTSVALDCVKCTADWHTSARWRKPLTCQNQHESSEYSRLAFGNRMSLPSPRPLFTRRGLETRPVPLRNSRAVNKFRWCEISGESSDGSLQGSWSTAQLGGRREDTFLLVLFFHPKAVVVQSRCVAGR